MSHILLVDADAPLRKLTKAAFEAAGYTAAAASSAAKAIALCEERQPDIIVLDLQLRGHSGVELLHELRSYQEWQHIPVILYTNIPKNDLAGFEKAFALTGIRAYCYKPETTFKKLIDTVTDVAVHKV